MSRAQSFTLMAVWPKSKPSTVRCLEVSRRRKGAKGQWQVFNLVEMNSRRRSNPELPRITLPATPSKRCIEPQLRLMLRAGLLY
jgi:hypothetical protein